MKIIYVENQGYNGYKVNSYRDEEIVFTNIKELKDFISTKPNPSNFNGLFLERDGKKETLVLPVILGDEGYKASHTMEMKDEDLNKFRPYFDKYEILPAGYSNPEITESFIMSNILKAGNDKERMLKRIENVKKIALNNDSSVVTIKHN